MCSLKQHDEDTSGVADAVSVGMTEGKGRGLFASSAMKVGSTILIERPLVAMQSLDNAQDVTVCRNCLGFAGDVISQLEVLSGIPRHECLKRHQRRHDTDTAEPTAHKKQLGRLSGLYECIDGCGEVYCSPECRSEHSERCHRLLCVGPVPEEGAQDHPLVAFRVHAMQTNEIFLLVGEVMARIASAFSKGLPSVEAAASVDKCSSDSAQRTLAATVAPFADFVQERWWEVAVPRDAPVPDDECSGKNNGAAVNNAGGAVAASTDGLLADTLRALCEESSALLRSAFALTLGPLPAPLQLTLGAENFGRVVGMFEQNNVGIRAPSPLPDVLRELSEGGEASVRRDAKQEALKVAAGLVGEIVEAHKGCSDDDEEACGLQISSGHEKSKGSPEDGQGCCGASPPSPVSGFADDKALMEKGRPICPSKEEGGDDALATLRSVLDGYGSGDDGIFAPLDGTALYSLVCCMNHSCRPNCVVRYPGRRRGAGRSDSFGDAAAKAVPLVAEVVLLEDVSAGDELTQSYITREMDLGERKRALEDYGFVCTCSRCSEELAALSS